MKVSTTSRSLFKTDHTLFTFSFFNNEHADKSAPFSLNYSLDNFFFQNLCLFLMSVYC